jgi:hypothetical protein
LVIKTQQKIEWRSNHSNEQNYVSVGFSCVFQCLELPRNKGMSMTITAELYAGEFQPSFLLTSLCIKTGCNNKDNKCYTFVAIGGKEKI